MKVFKNLILPLILLSSCFFLFTAYTSGPPTSTGSTGAPGDNSCARSGCHSGGSSMSDADFRFKIRDGASLIVADTNFKYTPGATYQMELTILTAATKYGFQVVALDAANQNAGTVTQTNFSNTRKQTIGGKEYMAHQNAGANNFWSYDWTAPAIGGDDVTFYIIANKANGAGGASGDEIITTNRTIKEGEALTSGIDLIEFTGIGTVDVLPNLIENGNINLTMQLGSNEQVGINIYDINGVKIAELLNRKLQQGEHSFSFLLDNQLSSGVYFINVNTENEAITKKIFIQ